MNDPRLPYSPDSGDERSPGADPGDGYSATALGSHWFDRPGPMPQGEGPTLVQPPSWPGVRTDSAEVLPDRVEGQVLRFGPGVTGSPRSHSTHHTASAVWHGTQPDTSHRSDAAGPPKSRVRGLRRYALAAVVLAAVLSFLAWQRYGASLTVEKVSVRTAAERIGCGGTADLVGLVDTDGRAGALVYRWVRSDGTTSGRLREKLARGQKQAKLHLLWTFSGEGEYRASAELQLISPSTHRASGRFDYRCDG
ncbi:hypothetical protein [Streptomyces albipurpureus]|uniref:Ig-like domain-containing protein n=1 Tax=Streptomyces albipurpureus TaxID=2897419 RepID=A0ABT0UQR8_9ACTN|nr:hypothetical protein [Streptomyces sp. CWNU-1]MCM2390591.1 hypothetical protein [Streptomyces sp. CWNU-1]